MVEARGCLALALLLGACGRAEPARRPLAMAPITPVATATATPIASAAETPTPAPPHVVEAPLSCAELPAGCSEEPIPANATIELERTRCYGDCPAYRVVLHASGLVQWFSSGDHSVESARGRVDPKAVRDLIDRATSACFFAMADAYRYPITDHASAIVTVRLGGKTKSVHRTVVSEDDVRSMNACPFPEVLPSLEASIDKVADGSSRGGKSR